MKTPTKKDYTEFLNEIGESFSEENFIIGGKLRRMKYGDALRKYDPIAFSVGYRDYCNNEELRLN